MVAKDDVLLHLRDLATTRTPETIAETLDLAKATVTKALKALESDGLVVEHDEQWWATNKAHTVIIGGEPPAPADEDESEEESTEGEPSEGE